MQNIMFFWRLISEVLQDEYFELYDDFILLQPEIKASELRRRFCGYFPIEVLLVLWNKDIIINSLNEMKIDNAKKLLKKHNSLNEQF